MSVWDVLEGTTVGATLQAQLKAGSHPHAWLFLGPPGAGKEAAAIAMASALNCREEPGVGCGRCSICLRIARRRFPDVHHIVPEGPIIPVDVIREQIIPEAARSAFEGSTKVFIIEEAHRMNPSAQNALLKTLEEPLPDVVFVLISDNEGDLLETITSRCRVIRLATVSRDRVAELLVQEGASKESAELAALVSDGDLDRARKMALDDKARERRELWLSIPQRLGSPIDALDAATEIVAEGRAAAKEHEGAQKEEIVELAEAMGEGRGTAGARNALAKKHRRELRRVEETVLAEALACLASFYRDVLAARSGASAAVVNRDVGETIETWAGTDLPAGALVTAVERLVEARAALSLNANVPLTIEAALLEVARVAPPAVRV